MVCGNSLGGARLARAMRRLATAGLVSSLLVLGLTCDALAEIHGVASIRLTTGSDYPPYTAPDLPAGGLATEIVREAFRNAGLSVSIDWLPWARGLHELQSGAYDATFPYIYTEERSRDFLFSDPFITQAEVLFVRKGISIDPKRLETLRGRIFCQPVGWAPTTAMQALLAAGVIRMASPRDIGQCLKMMGAGHADFFDSDLKQGQASIAEAGLQDGAVQVLSPPLQERPVYLIVSRHRSGAAQLLAQFNEGLEALKANGDYARIVAAHSKPEGRPARSSAPR